MEGIAGKALVALLMVLSGVTQGQPSPNPKENIIINNKKLQRRMAPNRQKRDWIIDTFNLQEELPGPYPKLVGTVKLEEGFQLVYKLQGKGVDEDPKGLFHINGDTGSIYVHREVDFETTRLFKWKFNAINKSSMKVDTRLGIHLKILDINDNAPEFKNKTYYVSVNESAVQGYTIYTMLAYDKDEENRPNSIVNYYLRSQMPTDPNVEFTIDKDKGFISFKGCLKYETNKNYKLVIEAQDNGVEIQQSSTCEVHVTVLDRNTYPPVLSQPVLHAEVPEQDCNVTILRFGISDDDTPFTPGWRAKLSIVNGDEDQHYTLSTDPKTNEGVLMVVNALDYEERTQSNLVITVENEEPMYTCKILQKSLIGLWVVESSRVQGRQAKEKTEIIINVLDRNDAPVFKPQNILITLEEHSVQPGTVLTTIEAKDHDIVAPNKIKYFLENDTANWLSINEDTGVITTKDQLDRESHHVTNSQYIVTVLAVDDGKPPMTGTANLIITVKDINDNVPKLLNPYITTCENDKEALLSTPIIDKDLRPYSGPFYIQVLNKDPEKIPIKLIDCNDDILKVKKEKDAYQGNHTLHLEIYDLQGVMSLENITVYVCDCLVDEVCIGKMVKPPTLGGGAIALLLLLPVFFILLCLLLCKIETRTVMVPVEAETVNSLIVYNEESEKECLEKIDSAFHRFSPGRCSAPATVLHNKTGVECSNSFLVHSMENQEGSRAGTLDRANRYRHSSYHSRRRQMNFERANSLRIHANASYRALSLRRKSSRTLETALMKNLNAQRTAEDLYKPRVYAEEGELSHTSSLEAISILGSSVNLSSLQTFGSKFNVLEHICEDHRMTVSTTVEKPT
ncbi:cadherin-like protein 26 [Eleutherodactylus coqui]|uniref:cadherin-like protein 26 n=1 Tax=Eleutherodactylus coqui TaxID=57060 RepID=UPI003461BBE0